MTDPFTGDIATDDQYDAALADASPLVVSALVPRAGMSKMARWLLTKEARRFLTVDAPIRLHLLIPFVPTPRQVPAPQIVTPPQGLMLPVQIFFDIDVDPADVGPNRMPYLSMPSPFLNPYPFVLAAGQWVIGAVDGPSTQIGIIVERLFDDAGGA